ncbi:MAG TPA: hypothetical protein VEV15_12350, partial [Flavisolibacter sp.]|nr:hypothetical protein [Flavisolibacter sp.]
LVCFRSFSDRKGFSGWQNIDYCGFRFESIAFFFGRPDDRRDLFGLVVLFAIDFLGLKGYRFSSSRAIVEGTYQAAFLSFLA